MFKLAVEPNLSLHEGDRAGVGCGTLQACQFEQKPRDDALDDVQYRREQLAPRHEQNTQRNRKRQHPLPHRHARDHLAGQVRGAPRHGPRSARGATPAPLMDYPMVRERMEAKSLAVHGWHDVIEDGEVQVFDVRRGAFIAASAAENAGTGPCHGYEEPPPSTAP